MLVRLFKAPLIEDGKEPVNQGVSKCKDLIARNILRHRPQQSYNTELASTVEYKYLICIDIQLEQVMCMIESEKRTLSLENYQM
ncbi:unnamed protein product [Paramecium sonneborni]|uniref:Uncharacterized protein n=1 Tax=Paramecium sonneborni TaxID=65129 RepID=A0A8S1RSD7_9CILI|nr:unnamed protein product [Paramecium sonneborni]